jgi:hypothetical protein
MIDEEGFSESELLMCGRLGPQLVVLMRGYWIIRMLTSSMD